MHPLTQLLVSSIGVLGVLNIDPVIHHSYLPTKHGRH